MVTLGLLGRPPAGGLPSRAYLAAVVVDLDLLFAYGLGDLALVGVNVLVEPHALLGHDALLDYGLLLVQHDLVLLVGDGGAVGGGIDVGIGDRLALHADLLAADRHRLGDLVLDDVLAQPHAAALAL